jgi:ATP-binding cassette, subfamily B, bacterial
VIPESLRKAVICSEIVQASALVRRPRLLVLDEAISSVDSSTEDAVTRTISDVAERSDPITINIAHRLSTVMHAKDWAILRSLWQRIGEGSLESALA